MSRILLAVRRSHHNAQHREVPDEVLRTLLTAPPPPLQCSTVHQSTSTQSTDHALAVGSYFPLPARPHRAIHHPISRPHPSTLPMPMSMSMPHPSPLPLVPSHVTRPSRSPGAHCVQRAPAYILQYLTVDGRYAHCAATTRSFELALDEGCLGRPDPHPGIRAGQREPCACTNSKWNRNFLAGPCTVDRNKYFPGDAPQTFCLCALTTLSPPPPVSLLLVASRLSPCLVVICTPRGGTSLLQT